MNTTVHLRGPDHPAWKGPEASYSAIHIWIRKYKPKPESCEHCGIAGLLDWANISGEYKRELGDWIALCRKCHRKFDRQERCPNGHERTPENIKVDYRGIQKCRVCINDRWREGYYRRKRMAGE